MVNVRYKWWVLKKNTWNHLTVCNQMVSNNSIKNKIMTTNEKDSSPSLSGETSEKRLMSYIFNNLPHNWIGLIVKKIFRQNSNGFEEIEPKTSQILSISRILEGVSAKHLEATITPRGVMVKGMSCGIVVREFVLQSLYYVHFRANPWGKVWTPLFSLQLWVNSRTD